MSHLESGFAVTDIEALAVSVKQQCPELELVRQKNYRTWATDHGSLVGDYPLPGIYQVKLMSALKKKGIDVHAIAKAKGVELPANLLDLLKKPWNLSVQRKLFADPAFATAYKQISADVVGKDAEFVIKYKDGKGSKGAYEIGLVPHPSNKGEYVCHGKATFKMTHNFPFLVHKKRAARKLAALISFVELVASCSSFFG